MINLGLRLRCALGDTGVSQRELARLTGITEVTLSRYVNGNRTPNAITLKKIADALGVGLDYFFTEEELKNSNEELNNSTDLISRQAAIDAIGKKPDEIYERTVRVDKNTMSYQTQKPTDFPTIEPERKKGEWIIRNTIFCEMCECTVCGASRPYTVYPMYYCPNCGAKMEGPEDIPMEYFESGGKVIMNE